MEQTVGFLLALGVMLIGVAGSLIPGLPGTPLLLAGAVGHRIYFGDQSLSNAALVTVIILSVAALGLDYLATVIGAKKLGATWRGIAGAIIGALVGLFIPFPGLIAGPFLGALLFEMAGGREIREATRAGLGAVLGLFVGAAGKVAVGLLIMAVFAFSVATRSENPASGNRSHPVSRTPTPG